MCHLQELDPALEPVLNKSIIKRGNRETIRLGDKELDYSRDFKLYITTKLANPHFTPEVSTKVRCWCGPTRNFVCLHSAAACRCEWHARGAPMVWSLLFSAPWLCRPPL